MEIGDEFMEMFLYYFLIFFIYSVLGWIAESIFVSVKKKKIVNRGFLVGPYCPIYGFGALIMVIYIYQYKGNLFTVFILSLVICTILEYITSYLMEKLYKARWWDYSDRTFNLNGRVCGLNAILFGVAGVFTVYVTQPIFDIFFININKILLIVMTILFLFIFVIDTIISSNIVKKLRYNLSNVELKKDSTQEMKRLVQEVLDKSQTKTISFLESRLIKAFPSVDLKTFFKIKNKKSKRIRDMFKKK